MKDKVVSVIMSVYNESEEWICKSLQSIRNQTYQNLQILVVLDNPDNTKVNTLIRNDAKRDKRIQVIENQTNLGLVGSLNKALTFATGEYIARMDADDISAQNRIEEEMKLLQEKDVDFVTTEVRLLYEEENRTIPQNVGEFSSRGFYKVMRYGNLSTHPTWLLKREIYDTLGGYRNLTYCEDYDFVLRALQQGFRCYRMGNCLLDYRIRKSGISQTYLPEQDYKARYLRKAFRRKKAIQSIDVEQLNEQAEQYAAEKRYQEAVLLLEKYSMMVAEGNIGKLLYRLPPKYMGNKDFRQIFTETAIGYVLQKKYRMKSGREEK